MTAIRNSVVTPVAVVAQHASHEAKPIRVLTNANLGEREQLRDLGFSVYAMDTASNCGLSVDDLDVDIVVLDRTVLGVSSIEAMAQFLARSTNVPVVFINGSVSLMKQAHCGSAVGSAVVHHPGGADSIVDTLRLAAAFARHDEAAPAQDGLTCGKLTLRNSCGFWNGADLDLTAGDYRIIELLASRPGQYFTYRAIYDRLRYEGFVSGSGPNGYWVNVRSAIKRIRNKFRAFDPTFQEIETYSGFGYRWRKRD